MNTKTRRLIGCIILSLSLSLLLWGIWPFANQERQIEVSPGDMQLSADVGDLTQQSMGMVSPAVIEQRRLLINYPTRVRSGDVGVIGLLLEIDEQGQLSVTQDNSQDNGLVESPEFEDVYLTYTVIAEARLEIAGVEYRPEGVLSEALLPGKVVKFVWNIRPSVAGIYHGAVWLYLRFVPLSGGEEVRNVLTAQRVKIETIDWLGLQGSTARLWGGAGTVVGSVVGLDGLLEWIWKRILAAKNTAERKNSA